MPPRRKIESVDALFGDEFINEVAAGVDEKDDVNSDYVAEDDDVIEGEEADALLDELFGGEEQKEEQPRRRRRRSRSSHKIGTKTPEEPKEKEEPKKKEEPEEDFEPFTAADFADEEYEEEEDLTYDSLPDGNDEDDEAPEELWEEDDEEYGGDSEGLYDEEDADYSDEAEEDYGEQSEYEDGDGSQDYEDEYEEDFEGDSEDAGGFDDEQDGFDAEEGEAELSPSVHEGPGASRTRALREEAAQAKSRLDDDMEDIEVPEWVVSMKSKLESSVAHAFLLEGDIRDYMVRNIPIRDGIVQVFDPGFETYDIIACYDQAQGLYFYGAQYDGSGYDTPDDLGDEPTLEDVYRNRFIYAMRESQAHLSLPVTDEIPNRDITGLFTIMSDMFERAGDYAPAKIMLFVDYADFLVPDASSAQMKPDERRLAIILSEMGRSELADRAGNCLVFLTDDLTQLSSRIKSTESRIEKINVPNPLLDERRDFIENVLDVPDRVIKVPVDEMPPADAAPLFDFDDFLRKAENGEDGDSAGTADDEDGGEDEIFIGEDGVKYRYVQIFEHPESVSTEYLAINSAGLSRIQIEDIVLRALSDDEPLSEQLVKDRKNEIIKQDYEDILEIIDPDHGFDRIGGLEQLKQFFREEVIEPVHSGDLEAVPMGVLLAGPPGTSKPILYYDTVKTLDYQEIYVKDISPGDRLFDRNGNICSVLYVEPKGEMEIYEVILKDGRVVHCSGDHPFIVLEKSHGKWKERQMSPQEMIDKGIHILTPADKKAGKITSNRCRFHMPQAKAVEYSHRDELLIDPYVMGCFLGDGCKNEPGNFELSASAEDEETVALIAEKLGAEHYRKDKGTSHSWHFYRTFNKEGDRKHNHLLKIGDVAPEYHELLSETYCHDKYIPEEYLYSSIEQRYELLRGLMDTDGCIKDSQKYKDKTGRFQMDYATTSIRMRDDFMSLIYSLGYSCSYKVSKQGQDTEIRCEGEDTGYKHQHDLYVVTINVPNEEKYKFFRLSRKKEIAERAAQFPKKRSYDRVPIVDVRATGTYGPMACISVDSPDHTFLVNDYIPTHNTFLSKAVAYEAGLNFVALNLNKIMDKYQGASERNLDRALDCAMAMQPTIIFIDEIDEALPNRADPNASAVNKRINQRLLTFFSETEHRGQVMILAATNYPEKIDPAFKRAGRFDIRLPMFAPDGFDRMRIIQIIAKSRKDATGKGYTFSWFESPDDVIHNPFRNVANWIAAGNAPINEKFVGVMSTYKYVSVDEWGVERKHEIELPKTLIDIIGKDEITLQQFYKVVRILFEDMEGRRTDPATGEVETEEDFFERIDDYVLDHIEPIGDDPDDYADVCRRIKTWERVYKPFQDKTYQMTGAELDVVMNKCITLWKKWCRKHPDKLRAAIRKGKIIDDHDIPFQPFLYDACRKTISAVSGIKEMEDNALLNTSDIDYIPDAMYAITDEGREISYLERQDELVNLKFNVVE